MMIHIVILGIVCSFAVAKDHATQFADFMCDDNENYENSTQAACKECLIEFLKPIMEVKPPMFEFMTTVVSTMYNCSIHFNQQQGFLKCAEITDLEAEYECVVFNVYRVKGGDVLFYPGLLKGYCTEYQGVTDIEECKSCGMDALKAAEGEDWIGSAKDLEDLRLQKSKVFFDNCAKFFPSEEKVKNCYTNEDPLKCWALMYLELLEGQED